MYVLHIFEATIHLLSIITASIVVMKIFLYDRLNRVTQLFIAMIYSSAYLTDTSYLYLVYLKHENHQLVFNASQVITKESTPFKQSVFCHEMGTWLYVWGVILTSVERVINSRYNNADLNFTSKLVVFMPMFLLLVGVCSYLCTDLLLNYEYQQLAGIIVISSQVFGTAALLYALYLNQKKYREGVGEELEQRYQNAYVYRFNRSLSKSLLGEIFCRLVGFSCIVAVTTGIHDYPTFGWLCFAYGNMIPLGNIAFPWFIVLRHIRLDYSRLCGQKHQNAVEDLNGRALAMTESAEEHFNALNKMWNS